MSNTGNTKHKTKKLKKNLTHQHKICSSCIRGMWTTQDDPFSKISPSRRIPCYQLHWSLGVRGLVDHHTISKTISQHLERGRAIRCKEKMRNATKKSRTQLSCVTQQKIKVPTIASRSRRALQDLRTFPPTCRSPVPQRIVSCTCAIFFPSQHTIHERL